jgi:hypothetical protein
MKIRPAHRGAGDPASFNAEVRRRNEGIEEKT